MNPTTLQTRFEQRLAGMVRQIANIAYAQAWAAVGLSADDVEQAIWLYLWERTVKAPAFLDQTDGYIATAARWHAKHISSQARTYTRNVDVIDDDALITGAAPTPEAALITGETLDAIDQVVNRLDPKNQTVYWMIVEGQPYAAICTRLGITKGAVSQRRSTITQQLRSSSALASNWSNP